MELQQNIVSGIQIEKESLMVKLKDILQERIPILPRLNMGFGQSHTYAKLMIKKSEEIIKSTKAGNLGKAKKILKDMEEIVKQIKRVLG